MRNTLSGCLATAGLCTLLVVPGCSLKKLRAPPPVARSSEEIGNVYVSAYPVVAWSDISASLQPKRNWKITDAESRAINVTAAQTLQAVSSLAGALGINLPAGATPGTPPAVPALALPTSSSAPSVPAAGSLTGLSSTDASQQLVAVTSLFQQAAILDNQIVNQYIPVGYAAYLLTFQINLQPSRNNWSYNALVDITIMPSPLGAALETSTTSGPNTTSLPPVILKPAIITDAIEVSSNARGLQEIRQALGQLTGGSSRAGAAALFGGGTNLLETAAGYADNSIITEGVVDDATLHIRLGASTDGTGRLVLTPRTYNVSVLVLTRGGDPNKQFGGISELAAVTHTYFSPTEVFKNSTVRPGQHVPTSSARTLASLAGAVAKVIAQYNYPPLERDCAQLSEDRPIRTKPFDIKNADDVFVNSEFLRLVTHGDYADVKRCLRAEDAPTLSKQEQFYRVLSEVSEIQETTRYSRLTIPLKNDGIPRLPDPGQYALVTDSPDGSQESITIQGGENLNSALLHPRATLTDNSGAWLLPASITISNSKQPPSIVLAFNAPSTLRPLSAVAKPSSSGSTPGGQFQRLELVWGPDYGQPCGTFTHQCYTNFLRVVSTPPGGSATPAAPNCTSKAAPGLAASAKALRATWSASHYYSGQVNIAFGDLTQLASDCGTPSATNQAGSGFQPPFTLKLSSGDIDFTQFPATGSCLSVVGNQFQVTATAKCMMTLSLFNLQADVPITFSLADSTGKALPASQVTLDVQNVEHPR